MIVSVVVAIGAADFNRLMDRAELKVSVRELTADLRYAQQLAAGRGNNCYVLFDTERKLYYIKIEGHTSPRIVKQVFLKEGIYIGTSYRDNSLHFTPLGAPSCGGTITLWNSSGKRYRITILPATGRVKVYEE